MLRYLQVTEGKPVKIVTAAEAMKRGAVVTENYATEAVSKAAAGALDFYFVDVEEACNGINAVIEPTADSWEDIAANDKVFKVVPLVGERYATTEVTLTLDKGTPVKASSGKFVQASAGDSYKAVFMGKYDDPTFGGNAVGIIQIVETSTVPQS